METKQPTLADRLRAAGYRMRLIYVGRKATVIAVHAEMGERYQVTAPGNGTEAVKEFARQVGVE